jgi:hypothetical protein
MSTQYRLVQSGKTASVRAVAPRIYLFIFFIQIKLIGISMVFAEPDFSNDKCNGSRVISVKRNINCVYQVPSISVFLVSQKLVKSNIGNPLHTYQHSNFHCSAQLIKVFHPPQKFERLPCWSNESTGLKVWRRGRPTFSFMT